MKVVAISTKEDVAVRYAAARQQGYVTFIYEHADPKRELTREPFVYVQDDTELLEKLRLVEADVTVADELQRA